MLPTSSIKLFSGMDVLNILYLTEVMSSVLMYGHEARLPINLARISEECEEICSEQEFDEKVKCMLELRTQMLLKAMPFWSHQCLCNNKRHL